MAAVEWDTESEGVEGDEGVTGSLVHVAIIGIAGGGGEIMGGSRWRRGGVKVCEGDYVVLLSKAVEEGEKGVFAARYQRYDLMGRRGQHRQ